MNASRTISALIACAATAALAAPAFAAQMTYHYLPPRAVAPESPIIVTEPRVFDDEAITLQVVDTLVDDRALDGRIGVQTTDRVVELTGIVTSAGQWRQAERDAKSVPGVLNVHNRLSTRIGGGRF